MVSDSRYRPVEITHRRWVFPPSLLLGCFGNTYDKDEFHVDESRGLSPSRCPSSTSGRATAESTGPARARSLLPGFAGMSPGARTGRFRTCGLSEEPSTRLTPSRHGSTSTVSWGRSPIWVSQPIYRAPVPVLSAVKAGSQGGTGRGSCHGRYQMRMGHQDVAPPVRAKALTTADVEEAPRD